MKVYLNDKDYFEVEKRQLDIICIKNSYNDSITIYSADVASKLSNAILSLCSEEKQQASGWASVNDVDAMIREIREVM